MNKATSVSPNPRHPGSARSADVICQISEDESDRDLNRELPYGPLEIVRANRLGALCLHRSPDGSGATFRQLVKFVIDLAAADINVVHSLRNHDCFVEMFAQPHIPRRQKWVMLGRTLRDHFGLAIPERPPAASPNEAIQTL